MGLYLSWILLVAFSLWVALLALLWGAQGGQFSDQERARFLPLVDEHFNSVPPRSPWKGKERYAFLLLAGMVLAVLGAAICLSMRAGTSG